MALPDLDTGSTPWVDRRTVLRGALTVGAGATIAALLAACDAGGAPHGITAGATPTPNELSPATEGATMGYPEIPEDLQEIPQDYFAPATQQGTLVVLQYDTYESMTYADRSQRLTKRAIVYLPYGYNEDTRYDVFYLMHGGWGNETTTLGTPESPMPFKHVLDNAIAAGEIAPLIVVCPTYNNTSPEDSGSFSLALQLTENYHHELLNDLMPAVEGTYAVHAEDVSPQGLAAARDHRGFGGFSMGSVTTWRTFQYCLGYFRYFLPMSCGTSLDMEAIIAGARDRDPADYFVWIITGTEDFAYSYDSHRVQMMRDSGYFAESNTEDGGNFAYRVKDGYGHDGVAANEYTYNGLRWFWAS